MKTFIKPKIVISKCIEFDSCRYNSQIIGSHFVKQIKPFVDFIPVCAEVEIGLGVPRDPIRIVEKNKVKKLIQPATGTDVSYLMEKFADKFIDSLNSIDGFILKSKSPSCGTRDVKIYPSEKKAAALRREAGFFGERMLKRYPYLAIEDEMRLENPIIREHFLHKIFTFADFRIVKESNSIKELIRFHSQNKLLLMGYSQMQLKKLGNIVANNEKNTIRMILENYQNHLFMAFSKSPRCTSNINVLMHAFGYISSDLSSAEKKYFFEVIKKFRQGQVPLSVPISLVYSWVVRNQQPYLMYQTFFHPYPDELLDARSLQSCGVRDFWK